MFNPLVTEVDMFNPLATKPKSALIFANLPSILPRSVWSSNLLKFLRYLFPFPNITILCLLVFYQCTLIYQHLSINCTAFAAEIMRDTDIFECLNNL